jgi:hypothetical protein
VGAEELDQSLLVAGRIELKCSEVDGGRDTHKLMGISRLRGQSLGFLNRRSQVLFPVNE